MISGCTIRGFFPAKLPGQINSPASDVRLAQRIYENTSCSGCCICEDFSRMIFPRQLIFDPLRESGAGVIARRVLPEKNRMYVQPPLH